MHRNSYDRDFATFGPYLRDKSSPSCPPSSTQGKSIQHTSASSASASCPGSPLHANEARLQTKDNQGELSTEQRLAEENMESLAPRSKRPFVDPRADEAYNGDSPGKQAKVDDPSSGSSTGKGANCAKPIVSGTIQLQSSAIENMTAEIIVVKQQVETLRNLIHTKETAAAASSSGYDDNNVKFVKHPRWGYPVRVVTNQNQFLKDAVDEASIYRALARPTVSSGMSMNQVLSILPPSTPELMAELVRSQHKTLLWLVKLKQQATADHLTLIQKYEKLCANDKATEESPAENSNGSTENAIDEE